MNFRGRRITAALLAGGTLLTGVGVGSAIAATSNQADTNGTAITQQHRPGPGHHRGPRGGNDQMRTNVEAAIAQSIGVTSAQLQAAREAGTSPVTLASQNGVSRDTVLAATVTALKANKPANAPDLTDAQLTQMAGNIIDNARPQPPAGDHGPGGPGGPGGQKQGAQSQQARR